MCLSGFRFCGNMPFKSKDEDTLYDLIKKGDLDFSDEVWNEVSSQGTLCLSTSTVQPVLSGHSKIDKTKILMQNDSLMKVESIAECSIWSILQYF